MIAQKNSPQNLSQLKIKKPQPLKMGEIQILTPIKNYLLLERPKTLLDHLEHPKTKNKPVSNVLNVFARSSPITLQLKTR